MDIKTTIEIHVFRSTPEIWGDCPFCGKTGEFYKNDDSGYFQFSCPINPLHDLYPGIIKNNGKMMFSFDKA